MSNMEHFPAIEQLHDGPVKTRELTKKQTLSVPCPTCGAATEERCRLLSGTLRAEAHRERKFSAVDAVEAKPETRESR
jgi:hypothetical protein